MNIRFKFGLRDWFWLVLVLSVAIMWLVDSWTSAWPSSFWFSGLLEMASDPHYK